VSYAPQAGMLGKRVHFVAAMPEDGYELRLEAVAEAVAVAAPGQKVLLINSPNNPTGRMLDAPFLAELAELCRREQVIVLSDEIYGLVPHGHKPHLSLARFYPEGTVILGGLSKHLSLGGWRLGVAVVPEGENGRFLLQRLRAIASEIWSTPTAPVQYAACLAYSNDSDLDDYVAECAQLHAARTQHLWSWLNELGTRCPQPDGGFYLFPNFDRWREPLAQRGVHTSDDLANYLLETYQIATLPGSGFGVPLHELSLRLATSYVDMETDDKAEQLLAAARKTGNAGQLRDSDQPMMAAVIGRWQQFVESLNS
ncbi:MAG: pyridoxal phosphate-dependent aminotransferase, partial [Anaerolineales bacterium]|nr:pyridoxal phosphate-dependent aminotransferase [Anaerolineales bacterium]